MKPKKGVFTNEMLDDIYQKLLEAGGQPSSDENGRPVYSLTFHGTREEFKAMKKRLLELDPDTKQP